MISSVLEMEAPLQKAEKKASIDYFVVLREGQDYLLWATRNAKIPLSFGTQTSS